MKEKTRKIIGTSGAIAVAIGTMGMLLGGADASGAGGIVGIAAGLYAAIMAMVAVLKK